MYRGEVKNDDIHSYYKQVVFFGSSRHSPDEGEASETEQMFASLLQKRGGVDW